MTKTFSYCYRRQFAWFKSICVLLAIAVFTVPQVVALTPGDVANAYLVRAASQRSDTSTRAKNSSDVSREVKLYLEEQSPKSQVVQDALLGNLIERISRMSSSELGDLAFAAREQERLRTRKQPNVRIFHEIMENIAYFTVATEEMRAEMARQLGPAIKGNIDATKANDINKRPITAADFRWLRKPEDQVNIADSKVDWAQVDREATHARFLDFLDFAQKTRSFLVAGNPRPQSEQEWASKFQERLQRLWPSIDPLFAADLGRLQYLMVASKDIGGAPFGVDALVPLAKGLKPFPVPIKTATSNDLKTELAQSRREAEQAYQASREIMDSLSTTESAHGFRATEVIPDKLLDREQFFKLLFAGYLPDDVGAGKEHGSLSHRLQWNAIMQHYNNSSGWNFTPLALYTKIGEYDLEVHKTNIEYRFGFERISSIWAHIFDLQGARGPASTEDGISRPDLILTWLAKNVDLQPLFARLEFIDGARQRRGLALLNQFENDPSDNSLTKEQRQWITTLVPKLPNNGAGGNAVLSGRTAAVDEIFQMEYYRDRLISGIFERAKANNDDMPVLIEKGKTFFTEPDKKARTESISQALLAGRINSPIEGQARPRPVATPTNDDDDDPSDGKKKVRVKAPSAASSSADNVHFDRKHEGVEGSSEGLQPKLANRKSPFRRLPKTEDKRAQESANGRTSSSSEAATSSQGKK